MNKMLVYQQKLIDNIKKTLSEWLSSNQQIPASEVRRFFHSVSGTAPTIELDEIGRIASVALREVEKNHDESWINISLTGLIAPILKECYQFQYEMEADLTANGESARSKVLFMVEKDTDFLIYVKDYLEKKGFHVFAFTEGDKALTALYDIKPDCILLDIRHDDMQGLETLTNIAKTVKTQYIPVMLLSDDPSAAVRVESYKKGADDFLLKPLNLEELYIRINRQIERKGFIDHLILVDELTGLYNRKYMRKAFPQLCSEQWKGEGDFAIAIIDLDHFKRINDQYGHLTGDKVLKGFSEFARERLRAEDILVRYGGEEFIIMSPNVTVHECKSLLDKILAEFSSYRFQSEQGKEFTCTFSSGVVEVQASVSTEVSYWLEMADIALYVSKENGRSQVTVFNRQHPSTQKGLSVALLEGDPIMQVLLSNTIQQAASASRIPVEISRFDSGEQLLESSWIKENQKGMVLLNLFMAGMNGIETLSQADFSPFTVLMLSAEKGKAEMIKAINLGVADYVIKPFSISSLENKIAFYLKKLADHSQGEF